MSFEEISDADLQWKVTDDPRHTLALLKRICRSDKEYELQCLLKDRVTSLLGGDLPFKQWVHKQCSEYYGPTVSYQCDGCRCIMTKCNGCGSFHSGDVIVMTTCDIHKKRFCCELERCCPQ